MRLPKPISALLLCVVIASAQAPVQQDAPPRSPEISTGGQVTLRLTAPQAATVAVRNTTGGYADWPGGNLVAMVKDPKGVWSATIGPLKPEYYTYVFVVDGVEMLDPRNVQVTRDGFRYSNALRIPGAFTANYDVNDVPHGAVTLQWYPSPSLNASRRCYIYTPPDYAGSEARYPVLYLLHGGGGDEDAWTTLGRAPEILDNLIAQGKVKPMIVVMPNENPAQIASPDFVPLPPVPAGGREPPSMCGADMVLFPRSLVTI